MQVQVIQPSPPSPLRVAAYCRVSTELESQETSFIAQCDHYSRYIRSNPDWVFAGIYAENGVSATSTPSHPQFNRLIQDCEQGAVDLIVTKSISRFTRNTLDCLQSIRLLNHLGTHIFFEKENLHTGTMESEFILDILPALAEEESRSISMNVKWGIRKRFESGAYLHARPPYGYQKCNGTLVVQPDEAKIVRRIYGEFLSGRGSESIAQRLNRDCVSTCWRASSWDGKTVRALVKNPVYTGDLLYQKTYRDEAYRQRINYGERDMYLHESHHEPIISKQDFNWANSLIDQRSKEFKCLSKKNNARNAAVRQRRYCFSGRIICGCCGGKMYRCARKDVFFYRCQNHARGRCTMKSLGEAQIKNVFLTVLNKLAFGQSRLPSKYRPLDLILQGPATKSLRRDIQAWHITGCTDDFPDGLFSAHVEKVLVYPNMVEFQLFCGLTLGEVF